MFKPVALCIALGFLKFSYMSSEILQTKCNDASFEAIFHPLICDLSFIIDAKKLELIATEVNHCFLLQLSHFQSTLNFLDLEIQSCE